MKPRSGTTGAAPASSPQAAARARAWTWSGAGLVAAAAVAVYLDSLGGALFYDDGNAIVGNPYVRGADLRGILTEPSWWGSARGPLWRPLTTLTFMLDHALHGLAPLGYHAVNVGLHALVSVLVLAVFAEVTGAGPAALAAALLFAVHPIHSEAVASVVGRAELVAALGFMAAWWCWLRADRAATARPSGRLGPSSWMALAAVAYFLGMLGKENAIALPAVLLLADLLAAGPSLRRHAAGYAALSAAALLFTALRAAVLGQLTPHADLLDNPLTAMAVVPRLLTAVAVIGLYAARLVFPLRLSADYSFDQIPSVTSPLDPGFLAGVAVLLGVAALTWWAWRRLPALALGLGMMAVTFALVSNLFFLIGTIMGERLAYLPSAGFCLAAGVGLAPTAAADGRARWSPALAVALGAVVALAGLRTVLRNEVWHDPLGFFTAMVQDAPRSARSHRELATVLGDAGHFAEARQAFERSLAIKPDDAATLYNFGNVVAHQGRLDEAVALYERAVAASPTFSEAMENLGNVESMRGDQQAALNWMRRAESLEPDSPRLAMNIANTLFRQGALSEARAAYEHALELAPTAPDILTNYGEFLRAQGDLAGAIRAYERISPPRPPRALVGLAASYRAQGNLAAARAQLAEAERAYPNDSSVRQMAEVLKRDSAAGAQP